LIAGRTVCWPPTLHPRAGHPILGDVTYSRRADESAAEEGGRPDAGVAALDDTAGRMMLHSWRLQLLWSSFASLPPGALRSLAKAGVRLPAATSSITAASATDTRDASPSSAPVAPAGPGSEWVAAGTSAYEAPDPLDVGHPGMAGLQWLPDGVR